MNETTQYIRDLYQQFSREKELFFLHSDFDPLSPDFDLAIKKQGIDESFVEASGHLVKAYGYGRQIQGACEIHKIITGKELLSGHDLEAIVLVATLAETVSNLTVLMLRAYYEDS